MRLKMQQTKETKSFEIVQLFEERFPERSSATKKTYEKCQEVQ